MPRALSRPPNDRSPPRRAWAPWLVVVIVLSVSAATTVSESRSSTAVVAPSDSCSALLSNATVLDSVDRYYEYANASLLPSKATAENHSLSAWSGICGSAAFVSAYANTTNRSVSLSVLVGDQNMTSSGLIGSLFATFSFTGSLACPAGGASYPTGFPCQEADAWTANLSLGVVTAHSWSLTSDRFVPCQTPQQNATNVATVEEFYPNPSQVPNESTAVAEIPVLWGDICTTSAYYDAYYAHGPNLSVSAWTTVGQFNSSPDLFLSWSFYWYESTCPQPPPSGSTDTGGCSASETWTADLLADSTSGPVFDYSYPLGGPGGPPPPGSPPSNTSPAVPSGGGGLRIGPYAFLTLAPYLAAVAAVLLITSLAWYSARGSRLGRPSTKYSSYAALARRGLANRSGPRNDASPAEDAARPSSPAATDRRAPPTG